MRRWRRIPIDGGGTTRGRWAAERRISGEAVRALDRGPAPPLQLDETAGWREALGWERCSTCEVGCVRARVSAPAPVSVHVNASAFGRLSLQVKRLLTRGCAPVEASSRFGPPPL